MNLPALAAAAGLAWTPVAVQSPAPVPTPGTQPAPVVTVDRSGAAKSLADMIADLGRAGLVAVGESHDDQKHHELQAEVVAALAPRGNVAVAFEMVDYDQQGVLDDFMAGRKSEVDFALWWNKQWGYDYLLYKPIFDAAKAGGATVHALNAPRRLVKAVSAGGLASLSAADRALLPAKVEGSSDVRYRDYVKASIMGHGKVTPAQLANRTEAMAVWNETMGEKAADLAKSGKLVIVIAGMGHVFYGMGVVESAARRGVPTARAVLPYPLGGPSAPVPDMLLELRDPKLGLLPLADWFRLIP